MAILENRAKTYNNFKDFNSFYIFILKRFFIVIFIIIALKLLYFSAPKRFSEITLEIAGHLISTTLVVYESVVEKAQFITEKLVFLKNLETENIELKLEIAKLRTLQSKIDLITSENSALRKLLSVVPDNQSKYIRARLLSVSSNPFNKSAIVGAGTKNGIEINQIVTNHQGLIGRIVEVSDNYAKIMLITDANSRIPIITTSSRVRGILAGDSNKANIIYLEQGHKLQKGEQVVTSGDGKIYPPNILVGNILALNKLAVVEPVVDLQNADFVNILYNGN
jgi:rod shape-determining protein MreC